MNDKPKSNMGNELAEGVFCDVGGTLMQGGDLSQDVFQALNMVHERGIKVTIFTGAEERLDIDTQALRQRGIPDYFLPIHGKSEYKGRVLEILIDDTDPHFSGLQCQHHISPFSDVLPKMEAALDAVKPKRLSLTEQASALLRKLNIRYPRAA